MCVGRGACMCSTHGMHANRSPLMETCSKVRITSDSNAMQCVVVVAAQMRHRLLCDFSAVLFCGTCLLAPAHSEVCTGGDSRSAVAMVWLWCAQWAVSSQGSCVNTLCS